MGRTSDAKERLIRTAVNLMRARGYGAVSVDDLCQGAGVRKGSFYHFFGSKRELALAALDAWWEGTRADVLEPALQSDVPPLERIDRVFARVTGQQARHKAASGHLLGCPLGNLAQELAAQDPVIRARLDAIFGHFAQYFSTTLDDACRTGALPPETDTEAGAQALLAYLYGTLLLAKSADDVGVMRSLAPHALRLVQTPGS